MEPAGRKVLKKRGGQRQMPREPPKVRPGFALCSLEQARQHLELQGAAGLHRDPAFSLRFL